jgi:fructokinase
MYKIGIDLGGSKTEGGLLDENLEILDRRRIPTPSNDYNEIVLSMVSMVTEFRSKVNGDVSIGIGFPGALSKTGLITHSNTPCLIGKSLKKDLEHYLKQKVSIENDSNCFALSEALLGAGRNYDVVCGVIMGTGIGAGIVLNGKIHSGRNNFAGEWGHHSINKNGNLCYCGRTGCVDSYISGPSLELRWTELTGRKDLLPKIIENLGEDEANRWKFEFLENFGIGIANMINILDPDVIILGGGLSNIPFLYDEGIKAVYNNVSKGIIETPILKNNLGDASGFIGAAILELPINRFS